MKMVLVIFFGLFSFSASSQQNYPVPPAAGNRLFYIQHSSNINTYVYDANFIKPKNLHESDPVTIHRILYAEGGERKELTYAQLTFAYGLNVTKLSTNRFELNLVSYPRQKLMLQLDRKGKAYVETIVNGKPMFLQRMFLKSRAGSSGFSIKPEYILFFGSDVKGKLMMEKFVPE